MTGLTGKSRFRVNWRGKLIFQVEYIERSAYASSVVLNKWRDAKIEDLTTAYRAKDD